MKRHARTGDNRLAVRTRHKRLGNYAPEMALALHATTLVQLRVKIRQLMEVANFRRTERLALGEQEV